MSSSIYIQSAVRNVKDLAKKYPGRAWSKRVNAPLPSGYEPDLNVTPELDSERSSFYQSQIGVLRWMVEIGQVDILTDVSVLSLHLALPREGHLKAIFHMFAYLEKKHHARIVFDPT